MFRELAATLNYGFFAGVAMFLFAVAFSWSAYAALRLSTFEENNLAELVFDESDENSQSKPS